MSGKLAYYFGCWDRLGHYLHDIGGRAIWDHTPPSFPAAWHHLMDAGLLKNGNVPDVPDGRVFWTCGGATDLWFAFFWWDRSVDKTCACNSGFYVRGFDFQRDAPDRKAEIFAAATRAFEYACGQFPLIVERQRYALALQP